MNSGPKMWKGVAVLLLFGMAAAVRAQCPDRDARGVILSCDQASIRLTDTSQIVRKIDDPHLGTRWLLMRDPDHPGGPGRLVMVSQIRTLNQQRQLGGPVPALGAEPLQPVIRAGERLVVEESSPIVEARLQGVALNPAAIGSSLEVRLSIGGRVVHAVAIGPGRAMLQPDPEVRP